MKSITIICSLVAMSLVQLCWAQVGIGTETPNASSVLDISSTNQGILLPRVSLSNVADTSLDGVNTAATGLLIWNSNASVTGGNGVGYYTFNGTNWEKITTSSYDDSVILKAVSTTSSTSLAQGSDLIHSLNSVAINMGGGSYDTATGTFTIPADGVYEIKTSFNVTLNPLAYEMVMSNRLFLNGVYHATTIEQRTSAINNSFGITYNTTFIEQFSAGDLVEIRATNLSTATLYGGSSTAGRGTFLIIQKID